MRNRGVFARRLAAIVLTALAGSCGGDGGSAPPPPPISVAFGTAPPASLPAGSPATVAAVVMNDPNNAGVTWTATCSAAACGSFNPATSASGAPSTYTAPATMPNPATVTVKATSVSDSSQSVSGTVTITAAQTPLLADGTYVYHLSGYDGAGPYALAGAFTVAQGKITGGEQDFSDPNAGYVDTLVAASSGVSAAGNNIQIVLDTGNGQIGVLGVETLRGTVVSATRVLLSEFDQSAAGTGALDLQTGSATPVDGYAFSVGGNDTHGNPLAIGGVITFSGGQLVTAGSVFDFGTFSGAAGSVQQNQSFQSGSVTAPDAFGRVTITLTPSAASGVAAFAFAGYVNGTSQIQLVESSDVLNANTGGTALGQGANTGQFSGMSDSVLNQLYVHGSGGVDPNGPAVMSGAFTLLPGGVLGGALAVNDLTNIGVWNLNGTYTVDPTGRVAVFVSSLSSPTATAPAAILSFQLYLDGNGNAMVMGADAFQTTQGIAFEQPPGGVFGGTYALSGQGALAITGGAAFWGAVGPVKIDAAGFSGSTDYTVEGAPGTSAVPLAGTIDLNDADWLLTGLNATDFSKTTTYRYFPVTNNRFWAIQLDNQGVSLLLVEETTP